MKCQEALELIGDLVDDDLDRQSGVWVRLHLLICRHCRRYLASYRATIRAEKNAFLPLDEPDSGEEIEEIPDEQVAAILKAVRAR